MLCTDATLDCRDFTAGGIFVFPFFLRQKAQQQQQQPQLKKYERIITF
jgi:hypothetical protein